MDNCFNTYATVGCDIVDCNLPVSQISSLTWQCPHHIQLLAECEHAAGLRLLHSLQKTYCTNHRCLHMTVSFQYCAFSQQQSSLTYFSHYFFKAIWYTTSSHQPLFQNTHYTALVSKIPSRTPIINLTIYLPKFNTHLF
jgi:hypothetical protein